MSADFVLLYAGRGVRTDVTQSAYTLVDREQGTSFPAEWEAWLAAQRLRLPSQNCSVQSRHLQPPDYPEHVCEHTYSENSTVCTKCGA